MSKLLCSFEIWVGLVEAMIAARRTGNKHGTVDKVIREFWGLSSLAYYTNQRRPEEDMVREERWLSGSGPFIGRHPASEENKYDHAFARRVFLSINSVGFVHFSSSSLESKICSKRIVRKILAVKYEPPAGVKSTNVCDGTKT